MRLRTSDAIVAGWKRVHELRGCQCSPEVIANSALPRNQRSPDVGANICHEPEYADVEAAQDGDVWAGTGWYGHPELAGGYWITCPNRACEQGVHNWWHASDCPASESPANACRHGRTSCWVWTGSAEDGTLTASPSLWSPDDWHGFLTNGEMRSV